MPQPANPAAHQPAHDTTIVITVTRNDILVNQESIPLPCLAARLTQIFQFRPNGVIFIRAEKDLPFSAVAQVIDLAKGAGIERVALMAAI